MSTPKIAETARVSGSTSGRTPASQDAASARKVGTSKTTAPVKVSEAGQPDAVKEPTPAPPPRFPWLSRLSQQLEPVAKQKPSFPSAPVLGDNVDRSA